MVHDVRSNARHGTNVPGGWAQMERLVRRVRERKVNSAEMVMLGEQLGEMLLPGPLAGHLRAARQFQQGTRIKLTCETSRLAALPWELARTGRRDLVEESEWLALAPDMSIVRTGEPTGANFSRGASHPELRVLAIDAGQLDGVQPLRASGKILQDTLGLEVVPVCINGPMVTWDHVVTALSTTAASPTPSTVLHFSGHGSADPPGAILSDDNGIPRKVDANVLASPIQQSGVTLAVFSCCLGGVDTGWASLGSRLVAAGLPAVISMQSLVEDIASDSFAQSLYSNLAGGLGIDDATTKARRHLKAVADMDDWWVPILHSREPESVRFSASADGDSGDEEVTERVSVSPLGLATDERTARISNIPTARQERVFLGRDDEIQWAATRIELRERATLSAFVGLGGVGKSELALRVARQLSTEDVVENVWWVEAETESGLAASLSRLAQEVGLTPGKTELDTAMGARRWLEETSEGEWLLVFDNVSSRKDLLKFAPSSGPHILATSRNARNWHADNVKYIGALADDDALSVLLDLMPDASANDKPALTLLAQDVGGLPLALRQAAAYMTETGCSAERYREILKSRPDRLLARGRDENTTVLSVIMAGYDALSPDAQRLLRISAWLDPDGLELSQFVTPSSLALLNAEDEIDVHDLVLELRRFSLISLNGSSFSVHRLVQRLLRSPGISSEEDFSDLGQAVDLVLGASSPVNVELRDTSHPVALQLSALAEHILAGFSGPGPEAAVSLSDDRAIELLRRTAEYHRERGADLDLALRASSKAYELAKERESSSTIAACAVVLQRVLYRKLGETNAYVEIMPILEDTLERIDEDDEHRPWHEILLRQLRLYGAPPTPAARDALDRELDFWRDAFERLERTGLEVRVETLLCLSDTYRYADMHLRAVEVVEELRGEMNDSWPLAYRVRTLGKVSLAHAALGRTGEALTSSQEAVDLLDTSDWRSSFELLTRLANLGVYKHRLGRLEGAVKDLERAVIATQSLAGDYSSSLSLRASNLGMVYVDLEDFDAAFIELERAVLIARAINDKSLHIRLRKLAIAHIRTGALDVAEELLREAVDLPRGRPDTAMATLTEVALVECLVELNEVDEAGERLALIERDLLPLLAEQHVARASCLEVKAMLQEALGQPCLDTFNESHQMFVTVGSSSSPDAARVADRISALDPQLS